MKNWLENLIIFLCVFLFIAGPYLSPIFGRVIPFPSFFWLWGPAIERLFPEGGLEGFALLFPISIAYIAFIVSFLVYLVGFIRKGLISQAGMTRKVKYFLPWLVYVFGLVLIPYFLFLSYLSFPERILLVEVPTLFVVAWFFITWKIGKKFQQ